jgi:hypothetical protein
MKAWKAWLTALCALAFGAGMGMVARHADAAPGGLVHMADVSGVGIHRFLDTSSSVTVACYVLKYPFYAASISCVRVAP